MKTYTVVGYIEDSDQRFAEHFSANSAEEAEQKGLDTGITVVAVFGGRIWPNDTKIYVAHPVEALR